jgi:hypothetical protein
LNLRAARFKPPMMAFSIVLCDLAPHIPTDADDVFTPLNLLCMGLFLQKRVTSPPLPTTPFRQGCGQGWPSPPRPLRQAPRKWVAPSSILAGKAHRPGLRMGAHDAGDDGGLGWPRVDTRAEGRSGNSPDYPEDRVRSDHPGSGRRRTVAGAWPDAAGATVEPCERPRRGAIALVEWCARALAFSSVIVYYDTVVIAEDFCHESA